MTLRILIGDCMSRMKELPDNSVDSVVCDPPYHLTGIGRRLEMKYNATAKSGIQQPRRTGFMGQTWDGGDVAFQPETWAEVLRVLKPGGHLVAFSGTRTYHRMAVAIEDAGFEVRDMIAWHYGSGFPKSHDISKAIDKARNSGVADDLRVCAWIRERVAELGLTKRSLDEAAGTSDMGGWWTSTLPHRCAIPTLEQWQKLQSVLGDEPEWMRPLLLPAREHGEAWDQREVIGEKAYTSPKAHMQASTFVENYNAERTRLKDTAPATDAAREWEGWGTALKPATEPICLARKPLSEKSIAANVLKWGTGAINVDGCRIGTSGATTRSHQAPFADSGWRTGHEIVELDAGRWPANLCHDGSDEVVAGFPAEAGGGFGVQGGKVTGEIYARSGRKDVGKVVGHGDSGSAARFFYTAKASSEERGAFNNHPTVKPVALMRWLVRLVTPKGGTVLDPFMGSGSTLIAADAEQFNAIGCELSPEYAAIAERRIKDAAGMFADVQAVPEPKSEAA